MLKWSFPHSLWELWGLKALARGCPSAPQMTLGSPSLGRRQVSGRETTTPRKSSPQISNRSSFSSHLLYPLDFFFTTNELRLYYCFILRDIFHTPTAQTGSCTTINPVTMPFREAIRGISNGFHRDDVKLVPFLSPSYSESL
jgi:hypothetical protein